MFMIVELHIFNTQEVKEGSCRCREQQCHYGSLMHPLQLLSHGLLFINSTNCQETFFFFFYKSGKVQACPVSQLMFKDTTYV